MIIVPGDVVMAKYAFVGCHGFAIVPRSQLPVTLKTFEKGEEMLVVGRFGPDSDLGMLHGGNTVIFVIDRSGTVVLLVGPELCSGMRLRVHVGSS